MRRVVLTLLAVLGVAAALTVTASSTTHVAYAAGMRGLALAAVVVVLEVVNVVGTWSWITDPRTGVRVESAVGVLAASTVTGWCGVLTFGPMGLVAPAGLLAAVHGVSRMWTAPRPVSEPRDESAERSTPEPDDGADTPVPDPDPSAEPIVWSDAEVLADLAERGEVAPTARSLRVRYRMRHDRATRLVTAYAERADTPDRSALGTGVSE